MTVENEEFAKAIIKAIDSIDRAKYNKVVVCNPCLENYFLFHADCLRCKVIVDNSAPTDKAYIFDRDEYERITNYANSAK